MTKMVTYTFRAGTEVLKVSASDVEAALNYANETIRKERWHPWHWIETGKYSFKLGIKNAA